MKNSPVNVAPAVPDSVKKVCHMAGLYAEETATVVNVIAHPGACSHCD